MFHLSHHQMAQAFVVCFILVSLYDHVRSLDVTVRTSYRDPLTGTVKHREEQIARYGQSSQKEPKWGWLVHVKTLDGGNHACTPPVNYPHYQWIALVQRGECKFEQKIHNAATAGNASAVIVYNNAGASVVHMSHDNPDVVAVFVNKDEGELLARLADSGICVLVQMAPNSAELPDVTYENAGGCLPTTTTEKPTTTRGKGSPAVTGIPQNRDDREQKGEEPQIGEQNSGASSEVWPHVCMVLLGIVINMA